MANDNSSRLYTIRNSMCVCDDHIAAAGADVLLFLYRDVTRLADFNNKKSYACSAGTVTNGTQQVQPLLPVK
jgi:hypothetical protein